MKYFLMILAFTLSAISFNKDYIYVSEEINIFKKIEIKEDEEEKKSVISKKKKKRKSKNT